MSNWLKLNLLGYIADLFPNQQPAKMNLLRT